ncbi:unnamed protein product [Rhizoctonia solani]|uniref:NACHT domain-containing protein n=1 Tax=Rhizoctonia solani TaxID=456999 RepID=A0A8H3C152_9AGAM|nr:unnamed protein product [Rhizoctonia solani]CAE7232952.1 unnamed protein product [Rhizoctonia solani]
MPNRIPTRKGICSILFCTTNNSAISTRKPRSSTSLGNLGRTTAPETILVAGSTNNQESQSPASHTNHSIRGCPTSENLQLRVNDFTTDPNQPTTGAAPDLSPTPPFQEPSQKNVGIPLEHEPKTAHLGWRVLDKAMRALHLSAEVIPPVQSAVGHFISCLDHFETARKNREDYDQVASELSEMADYLSRHLNNPRSQGLTDKITEIARIIHKEIEDIHKFQDQSKPMQVFRAMDREQDLTRRFQRIGELFRRIQMETSMSEWSHIEEALVIKRLGELKPVMLARYNSTIADSIGRRGCTEDTRQTTLSEIEQWCDKLSGPVFFWMNGMVGTGKTTIAYTLANNLAAHGRLGASFFCTVASEECCDASKIIPTVAYQLAHQSSPFQAALNEALKSEPDAITLSISEQLKCLLVKPLQAIAGKLARNLIIVIDALDECTDDSVVTGLLDCLFSAANQLPIKFFIASRPERGIYERLATESDDLRSVLHLHQISWDVVQNDIRMYLKKSLAPVKPSEAEIDQLTALSGRLFIYAATAVRYIAPDDPRISSKTRLETMLDTSSRSTKKQSAIDSLYSAILSAAVGNDDLEPEERDSIKFTVWVTVCSDHPVPINELVTIAGLGNEPLTQAALASLRSVLSVSQSGDTISAFHASFPEFIFDRTRSGDFSCEQRDIKRIYALRCLRTINTQPLHQTRPDTTSSSHLTYASSNWFKFLERGHVVASEDFYNELAEFFNNRFENWVWFTDADGGDIQLTMWLVIFWLRCQLPADQRTLRAAWNAYHYVRANEVGKQLMREEAMKIRANTPIATTAKDSNKSWIWEHIDHDTLIRILQSNPCGHSRASP